MDPYSTERARQSVEGLPVGSRSVYVLEGKESLRRTRETPLMIDSCLFPLLRLGKLIIHTSRGGGYSVWQRFCTLVGTL